MVLEYAEVRTRKAESWCSVFAAMTEHHVHLVHRWLARRWWWSPAANSLRKATSSADLRSKCLKTGIAVAAFFLAFGVRVVSGAELPVGFTDISVPGNTALRGDPSDRLKARVWYPATSGTLLRPIIIGPLHAPLFMEGEAGRDAAVADMRARMPFVVISHGTGGTAMDLAWLCAGLAARGFIVAAVDHPGNNALEPPTVAGTSLYWLRAEDLSRVISGVLAIPRFGKRIDTARIGAAGESLGGYTVLEIAGARTDSLLLDFYCAHKPRTPVCTGEASPAIPGLKAKAHALALADAEYRAAVASGTDSHRDPRVKAVFSIEPAEGPAIIPASLEKIGIPIAFVAGLGDRILPLSDNVIPDAVLVPNAEVTLFPKPAGHYTFLMNCTPLGRQKYRMLCADAGPERVTIHRDTLELAASFFARTIGASP
jgi:predicted dienelactone hydrolase